MNKKKFFFETRRKKKFFLKIKILFHNYRRKKNFFLKNFANLKNGIAFICNTNFFVYCCI